MTSARARLVEAQKGQPGDQSSSFSGDSDVSSIQEELASLKHDVINLLLNFCDGSAEVREAITNSVRARTIEDHSGPAATSLSTEGH
mmetsp:Transcript_9644/g.21491  ORF Transcript_9644/g.21491 Transcript_9644/m.21491 type:complete len:87 (-) Transcript_9644:8-268(-)